MNYELKPRILVFGVGGAGGNAVDNMIEANLQGVEFIAANTDAQALSRSKAETQVQLGPVTTSGLGAGAQPQIGEKAAEESIDEIKQHLEGAHMVFIAAGMGGGTGTGASPVIAQIARETGALTVAVVTRPFDFEGLRRMRAANEGINRIKEHSDTLLAIPNERLHAICEEEITAENAFKMADDVLRLGVQSIAELVTVPGEINLDFADVEAVMRDAGPAWMSIGWGVGEDRARDAAHQAISNPLLDVSIEGARGVLFNITGGSDMKLSELHEASEVIQRVVDPEANIIFGMTTDMKMENEIKLTVIATGFPTSENIADVDSAMQDILNAALAKDPSVLDLPPFLRRIAEYGSNGSREAVVGGS